MAGFMDPYDAEANPAGVILLAVAENKLCWDLLKPQMETGFKDLPQWTASYGPMQGQPHMTDPLGKFLGRHVMKGSCTVKGSELVCGTGVSAILSSLFFSICEEGDTVLIPSPYYSAFDNDLRAFGNVARHAVPLDPSHGFALTPAALDEAYAAVVAATGKPPKALLLTNPHNPLGRISPRAELEAVAAWAESKAGLHLVSDEIYALSVHGPHHGPGVAATADGSAESFTSMGTLKGGSLGLRTHVLWGMSKDLGVSGLRFGVCWTQNPRLFEALCSAAIFTSIPGPVQAMLGRLFGDEAWGDMYVAENARRLAASYDLLAERFAAWGLGVLPAAAGMFCWVDLRPLLQLVELPPLPPQPSGGSSSGGGDADGWRREAAVYDGLCAAKVVLTPGSSQHHGVPGWFRVCFAFVPLAGLSAALDRIEAYAATLGYRGK